MSSCINCGKYTIGNKYCYNCYQEILHNKIQIKPGKSNKCIKCLSNIKELAYCESCYNKNVPLTADEILLKHHETYAPINELKEQVISINTTGGIKSHSNLSSRELINLYLFAEYYEYYTNRQYNSHQITFCKICSKDSKGKPLCYNCYKKLNMRELSHDPYNNQKYQCDNGYIVRSQGERTISDFLSSNNIPHQYEKKLYYKQFDLKTHTFKEKSIKPDFYIEGPIKFNNKIIQDTYIEYFGLQGQQTYDESNEYKISIYNNLKSTVIIIYPEDIENYKISLTKKLSNFKQNTINYKKEH